MKGKTLTRNTKHFSGNTGLKTGGHSRRSPRGEKNGKARLVIVNGCFSGLEMSLGKAKTTLGSDIGCDICLDHSFVSEEHATISRTDGYYVLEDLNSRHGTSINGNEVHRIRLKNGDLIGIGNFEIRFHE